ncbi:hypothetical protein ANCCAN_18683 [Ancylostoma caninum]|uniref:Uncharacterized protein n=1 Tax=Ancylostoma caninum TaxID=29170 RepID=A0A368FXB9_ANCCA|nr:hypothetical protein ANCCAN_18683 [Ancylostoma caninum]
MHDIHCKAPPISLRGKNLLRQRGNYYQSVPSKIMSGVEPHPVGMIATLAHVARNWESIGNEFLRIFKDYPYFLAAIKGARNGIV